MRPATKGVREHEGGIRINLRRLARVLKAHYAHIQVDGVRYDSQCGRCAGRLPTLRTAPPPPKPATPVPVVPSPGADKTRSDALASDIWGLTQGQDGVREGY